MPITVAIVEDDADICEDLVQIIEAAPDFACLCACRNAATALRKIPKNPPDIIIMDIQLPDASGIECTAKLKRLLPDAEIMMYTVSDDTEQILKALKAGATGYLLKGTPPAELINALREIKNEGVPMSSEIARKVVCSFHRSASGNDRPQVLTDREEDVLKLLAEGFLSKEIAARLSINVQTVNYHLKQIYQKYHVRSRTEATIKYLTQVRASEPNS